VPDWLIALIFGFVVILVGLPVLAGLGISLVDVLARLDIGVSRLVWLGVILVIPLAGMGLYWLFRPKDFDPLHETERPNFLMGGPSVAYPDWILTAPPQPVVASAGRMTPALQGGADPEPEDESDPAA
jgi:hypothetical protein